MDFIKTKVWTEKEEQFLIDNYKNLGAKQCAATLNKTLGSCKHKAMKLKVTSKGTANTKLLAGMRFNKLILIKSVIMPRCGHNGTFWECKCDCGNLKIVYQQDLRSKKVGSCGCLDHKLSNTNLYKLWRGIKNRCLNKNSKDYHRYGAIGIKLYEPWINDPISFIQYIKSTIGDRPTGKTLDRINNKRGYEPENLRWATGSQQMRNSRNLKINESIVRDIKTKYNNGVKQTDLAVEYNLSKIHIWRIINGQAWSDVKC